MNLSQDQEIEVNVTTDDQKQLQNGGDEPPSYSGVANTAFDDGDTDYTKL